MLRAIPVERFQAQPKDAFECGFVVGYGNKLSQRRSVIERKDFRARVDLEPGAADVVHKKQADTAVGGKIAGADVLAIAAIVRESKRPIVDQLEKTARTAAVLNVGPPRFRNRCNVEAVALGDESSFVLGESIKVAMPFEVLLEVINTHLGLRGPDAGRYGNIEKTIRHDGPPLLKMIRNRLDGANHAPFHPH